jgi:hypothetical protein
MIFVVINLFGRDKWVVLMYLGELSLKIGKNSLIEYLTPILGHQDKMILAEIYAMA